MRRALSLSAAALLLTSGAARGQSASQPWTLTGQINAVSDYRFRGVSFSNDRPALQAWLTLNGPEGVYVQAWTSTIANYGGARQELDGVLGDRQEVAGFDVDLSVVRYGYPSANRLSFWEVPIAISRTVGRWTWTGGAAYAPAQVGTTHEANVYAYVSGQWRPTDRLTLSASVGRENGAFGQNKLDWSVGETLRLRHVQFSLTYVGVRQGRMDGALVGSAGVVF